METKSMIINRRIRNRVVKVTKYILRNRSTVRDAAKHFGVSKSTIHTDITDRLKEINPEVYRKMQKHIELNLQERHARGGRATKQKYTA